MPSNVQSTMCKGTHCISLITCESQVGAKRAAFLRSWSLFAASYEATSPSLRSASDRLSGNRRFCQMIRHNESSTQVIRRVVLSARERCGKSNSSAGLGTKAHKVARCLPSSSVHPCAPSQYRWWLYHTGCIIVVVSLRHWRSSQHLKTALKSLQIAASDSSLYPQTKVYRVLHWVYSVQAKAFDIQCNYNGPTNRTDRSKRIGCCASLFRQFIFLGFSQVFWQKKLFAYANFVTKSPSSLLTVKRPPAFHWHFCFRFANNLVIFLSARVKKSL